MIQINQLSKFFGEQLLFEGVNLNFSPGERVGFVGRNGSGKSTLFKIILNKLVSDAGNVIIPKGYKIGYLEQHIEFNEKNVLEECSRALTGDDQYSFYLAESILMGLGFQSEDFTKDPQSFSGGYQVRINLAKALLGRPNMLLLDEPTNYLDIVSIRWLKTFLKSFQGEVMIITHDREFMDSVVTHVMGITRRKIKKIKGTTSKFYEQLSLEDEVYYQTKENFDRRKKELQLFADRFKAKASKASQAQSKLKEIARMGDMDELSEDSDMGFSFHYKDCPGKVILTAENLSFSYDGTAESYLFEGLNIDIKKQDRIGIIGKNGKGKSTLLNVLAGELEAVTGKVQTHPSLQKGHFGQININRLHIKNTVIDEITESNPTLGNSGVRSICGAMLFSGDKAEKKIDVLSGGERSRVLLGKILAHPTNLLILDEPTNHLDMESIEILTEEIKAYKGALIIVTHSEELLKSVVNKLIVFRNNKAECFNGNYREFLEKIGWEGETEFVDKKKEKRKGPTLSRKEYKKLRQEIIQERSKICNPLKKKIEELENIILEREEEMEILNNKLVEASQAGEGAVITDLSQQIGKIQISLVDVYEELDLFSNKLEKLTTNFDTKLTALDK
jgi:ATP-binding cassette, subfamily F, member 3